MSQQTISKIETVQTAVEWLIDWIGNNQYFIGDDLLQAFKQAKQMEKEQIMNAYNNGNMESEIANLYAEKFYKETYNK